MHEQFATLPSGIELCYETFGDPADPAVLLIMGLGTQMIAWHEDFCAELVDRGFFVIRFDNRDTGRSTYFSEHRPPSTVELATRRVREPAYRLADMADDAAGLLDVLDIAAAHVVGASMGGMIAQLLAARHPGRCRSLVSIMSSSGSRWTGQPAARVLPFFLKRPPRGREANVERIVALFSLVGSTGFDRDERHLREITERSIDRGGSPDASARQLGAIIASGSRVADLRTITAPALVIHGSADKLVAPSGGKATANEIRDAELLMIDGMGHDLPRGAWPLIIDGIERTAARAMGDRAPAPAAGASGE